MALGRAQMTRESTHMLIGCEEFFLVMEDVDAAKCLLWHNSSFSRLKERLLESDET